MDTALANLYTAKKNAVLQGADTSKIDADIAKIKKAKYAAAKTPSQISKVEENEEAKKLSPKQKKLASAAAPHDKITGADFKAMKKQNTQKESTDIANFIKSISQKKYASADKYLKGVVEAKLKNSISKAVSNTK